MKNYYVVLIFIVASISVSAQPGSLPDPEAVFFALIVKDIDRSFSWYADNLGFQIVNQTANEERGFKQANLKRGNILIELIQSRSAIYPEDILTDHSRETRIAGFFKFGVQVAGFDQWVIFLTQANVEFAGNVVTDRLTGKKMVIIKDPDGNRIQLFEK